MTLRAVSRCFVLAMIACNAVNCAGADNADWRLDDELLLAAVMSDLLPKVPPGTKNICFGRQSTTFAAIELSHPNRITAFDPRVVTNPAICKGDRSAMAVFYENGLQKAQQMARSDPKQDKLLVGLAAGHAFAFGGFENCFTSPSGFGVYDIYLYEFERRDGLPRLVQKSIAGTGGCARAD